MSKSCVTARVLLSGINSWVGDHNAPVSKQNTLFEVIVKNW